MKKKIILLMCIAMIFSLTACTNDESKENIKKETKSIGQYKYKKTIKCDVLNDIKNIYTNFLTYYIVTNDNQVYLLSLDKPYSNNTNCKKVENLNFQAHLRNYIIDNQGNYYRGNYEEKTIVKTDDLPRTDIEYIKNKGVIKTEISDVKEYVLLSDGIIYKGQIDMTANHMNVSNEIITKIDNEKIIDFYLGNSINEFEREIKYLITDKAFYTNKEIITNKEECNKYADIKCEKTYKLVKNEQISNKRDELVGILPWVLINKKGEVYINTEIEREFFGG